MASLLMWGAIWQSGKTDEQSPAPATAPGMPQTTLLTSSWPIVTVAPLATAASEPRRPSLPMPVRMTIRSRDPWSALRLLSVRPGTL